MMQTGMRTHLATVVRTVVVIVGLGLGLWHIWQTVCRAMGWNLAGPHPAATLVVGLLVIPICGGIAWIAHRRYERAMNRMYTTEERERLRVAFRALRGRQSQQLQAMQWRIALFALAIYATVWFVMFPGGAPTWVAFLAAAAMFLVLRPLLGKGVTADLDDDAEHLLLRPTKAPNTWRAERDGICDPNCGAVSGTSEDTERH